MLAQDVQVCVFMYACMQVHPHTYKFAHAYANIRMQIYTYICMDIHTHKIRFSR